jgi:hypothetical protein
MRARLFAARAFEGETMEWTNENADEVLQKVIERSRADPEFRALALSDSRSAIALIEPRPLPPGFTVRFVDNERADRTFVLPDPVPVADNLTDAELEQVAGGSLITRCNSNSCGNTCNNSGTDVIVIVA